MEPRVDLTGPKERQVEPKLKRWFYPIPVLLKSLDGLVVHEYKTRRKVDQPLPSTSSPEDVFRDFLSKIAFLCWSEINAAAISACAVLQACDGTVEYVFAFNNRSSSELSQLETNIRSILQMLRHFSDEESKTFSDERKREILRLVLKCNVNRVRGYLRAIEGHLTDCIADCDREDTAEATRTAARLQGLLQDWSKTLTKTEKRSEDEVNIAPTEELIWSIHSAYKSPDFRAVQDRALQEQETESTHWTELIHVVGRLMTYKQAIDVLATARTKWPRLFEGFDITMVPSSASATKILNERVMTAAEIIRKMSSDPDKLAELNAEADKLLREPYGLDRKIRQEWSKRPRDIYVHAEMQLLHWLENNRDTDRATFFLGIKFIGTSKPPCKLCSYFFREYDTDVEVRPSHLNLYLNWLLPDFQGPKAPKVIQKVTQRIRDRLLDDIYRALVWGERHGRPHDSSNYSTRRGPASVWPDDRSSVRGGPALSDVAEAEENDALGMSPHWNGSSSHLETLRYVRAQAAVDEISEGMGALNMQSGHSEGMTTRRLSQDKAQPNRGTKLGPDSDDEDDGGGVLVFRGRGKR